MRFSDFDFDLPPTSIAREPIPDRDDARLLVLRRATGEVAHHRMRDLPDLLEGGDRLVVNNSRVTPSMVEVGGQRIALGQNRATRRWEPLGAAAAVIRPDRDRVGLSGAAAALALAPPEVVDRVRHRDGKVTWPRYLAHLEPDEGVEPVPAFYNTVYARVEGSVAPPSGGLNLSEGTLAALAAGGVDRSTVTHHVGHVTFRRPADDTLLRDHAMEGERFAISAATAGEIAATKAAGGRVVSVGTTSTRALEYAALHGGLVPGVDRVGVADLFIRPGHEFAVADGLLTGLHAPKTTLLVLVCAFGGREAVLEASRQAVAEGYRWYTLGDSMLIL